MYCNLQYTEYQQPHVQSFNRLITSFLDIGCFAGSRVNAVDRNDDSALQLVGEHVLTHRSICLASTPLPRFVHCIIALRRPTIALSCSYVGMKMLSCSLVQFVTSSNAHPQFTLNIQCCSSSFSRDVKHRFLLSCDHTVQYTHPVVYWLYSVLCVRSTHECSLLFCSLVD